MPGLGRVCFAVLLLVVNGCSKSAPPSPAENERAEEPAGLRQAPGGEKPEPLGRTPEPVGPKPGQGCRQVTLEPPCTLAHFGPSPAGPKPGLETVSYLVRYTDAKGREVTPYWLDGKRQDQPALANFFKEEKNRVVQCQGGWTSAPCNDTPFFSGFPEPPVGSVTRRGR